MVKTAYVSVKFQDAINNCCLGSAGPKPSIKGMRDKFWVKKLLFLKVDKMRIGYMKKIFGNFIMQTWIKPKIF